MGSQDPAQGRTSTLVRGRGSFKVQLKENKLKQLSEALSSSSRDVLKRKLALQAKLEKYADLLEQIDRARDGQATTDLHYQKKAFHNSQFSTTSLNFSK
jgi:ATP phosphoribosyltransferase